MTDDPIPTCEHCCLPRISQCDSCSVFVCPDHAMTIPGYPQTDLCPECHARLEARMNDGEP